MLCFGAAVRRWQHGAMSAADRAHLVSSDVRDHNLGLVLTSLDRGGPAARAELAAETGLTRGAVTSLASELLGHRLVRACTTQKPPTSLGRPLERLELDGALFAVVGAQVEVDEVMVLALDVAGRTLYRRTIALRTPFGDAAAVAELVADAISACYRELADRAVIPLSLDVVVPGPVQKGSDTVAYAIDLGWTDVPFGRLVADRLPAGPTEVRLSGDGQPAAYAEFVALRDEPGFEGLTDILYLKSGTGIGGGVVNSGRVLEGTRGRIFPAGHIVVEPGGLPCLCGRRGCLVTVADPELVIQHAGLSPLRDTDGLPAALDELVARIEAAEPAALTAAADAFEHIRTALDTFVMVYEPQVVVLGGWLAPFTAELSRLPPATLEWVGVGAHVGEQAFVAARVGAFAALQGALTRAREAALASPMRSGLLA